MTLLYSPVLVVLCAAVGLAGLALLEWRDDRRARRDDPGAERTWPYAAAACACVSSVAALLLWAPPAGWVVWAGGP